MIFFFFHFYYYYFATNTKNKSFTTTANPLIHHHKSKPIDILQANHKSNFCNHSKSFKHNKSQIFQFNSQTNNHNLQSNKSVQIHTHNPQNKKDKLTKKKTKSVRRREWDSRPNSGGNCELKRQRSGARMTEITSKSTSPTRRNHCEPLATANRIHWATSQFRHPLIQSASHFSPSCTLTKRSVEREWV